VVRNVLREWLKNPPVDFRVEPVYATVEQPYRYARKFTSHFLGVAETVGADEPIDFSPGDIFFALDLQPQVQAAQSRFLQSLRLGGVTVKFMVYDLLSISHSQYFVEGAAEGFTNWLYAVGESDGAVCISKSVAEELEQWMKAETWQRQSDFKIEWSHLGADIEPTRAYQGHQERSETVIGRLQDGETFLMVGTLEPRKGHSQVLDAFEQLWLDKHEMNLAIVGKQGWLAESLVKRLRSHVELNKHLFFFEAISDEQLKQFYAAGTCLIAASYGEGFGLPLIEAAQHKLPIIARDIRVFREVAGEHAFYFSAATSDELAQSITDWLALYRTKEHPRSDQMSWLTWKDSAWQLSRILTENSNQ
jgi:glycosyltransferase involved in cell wall biosynthesis